MTSKIGLFALALTTAMLVPACVAQEEGGDSAEESSPTANAEEWKPEFVDGKLQPLPDGFPDQEITMVSVDVAGSRDGIYVRALEPILDKIAPVDVVISDEPATQGGTVHTLADTKTRPGGMDGYFPIVASMPGTSTDFLIEPITEETGLTVDDISFLISTEVHPYVLAQRTDAPWGDSFEEFIKYGQNNPGKLRYISHGVGSGHDIAMEWLMSELNIKVNKIPGSDAAQKVATVAAGDGDFTMNRASEILPVAADDRIRPIFFTSEQVPQEYKDDPGVASAADYPKYDLPNATWGVVQGFMLPAEVPDLHERWLYEMFKAAYETDEYKKRADTVPGVQLQLRNSKEATEVALRMQDFARPVVRKVGLGQEGQ